jgi:hypothetical protein
MVANGEEMYGKLRMEAKNVRTANRRQSVLLSDINNGLEEVMNGGLVEFQTQPSF